MPRILPLAALGAASLIVTLSSTAKADAEGEAVAALVALAAFDVVSIPADIVMAATGTAVPRDYALAEVVLGSLQSLAGGIGLSFCATERDCKSSAALPVLIGFTAYTSVMAIHGAFTYQGAGRKTDTPSKASSFAVVPIVSGGHSKTVGLGVVGVF